jgi:hypothetical protein
MKIELIKELFRRNNDEVRYDEGQASPSQEDEKCRRRRL